LASGHDDDRTLESNNCDTITLPAAHHILAVDEPGARALQRPSVVAAALSPIEALQAETQIQSCFRNYRSPNEEPCWLKMAGMISSAFN
jgi:hypothetical protein